MAIYNTFDDFAYSLSTLTRFDQTQIELLIKSKVFKDFVHEDSKYIINNNQIQNLDSDIYSSYKAYTLSQLADVYNINVGSINDAIKYGKLNFEHHAKDNDGKQFILLNSEEFVQLKNELPKIIETTNELIELSSLDEPELEQDLSTTKSEGNEKSSADVETADNETKSFEEDDDFVQSKKDKKTRSQKKSTNKSSNKNKTSLPKNDYNAVQSGNSYTDNNYNSQIDYTSEYSKNYQKESYIQNNNHSAAPDNYQNIDYNIPKNTYSENNYNQPENSFTNNNSYNSPQDVCSNNNYNTQKESFTQNNKPDAMQDRYQSINYNTPQNSNQNNNGYNSQENYSNEYGKNYEKNNDYKTTNEFIPTVKMDSDTIRVDQNINHNGSNEQKVTDTYINKNEPLNNNTFSINSNDSIDKSPYNSVPDSQIAQRSETLNQLNTVKQDSDSIKVVNPDNYTNNNSPSPNENKAAIISYNNFAITSISKAYDDGSIVETKNLSEISGIIDEMNQVNIDHLSEDYNDLANMVKQNLGDDEWNNIQYNANKENTYQIHLANGETVDLSPQNVAKVSQNLNGDFIYKKDQSLDSNELNTITDKHGKIRRTYSIDGLPDYSSKTKNNTQDNQNDSSDMAINNVRKKHKIDKSGLASLGHSAIRMTVGSTDIYQGYSQVKRYFGWVCPTGENLAKTFESASLAHSFKLRNKAGVIDNNLQEAGIKSSELTKKGKHGEKYKSFLSNREYKSIMKQLNEKFQSSSLHSTNLDKLSMKELKSLSKKLNDKDQKLLECYMEFRKRSDSKNRKGGGIKNSLTNILRNTLKDADFYQGMDLIMKYVRVGKQMAAFKHKAAATIRKQAVRWVKPYAAHVKKIETKKAEANMKRTQKKQDKVRARTKKRQLKSAKRKELINRAISNRTGRTPAQWKKHINKKMSNTKLGKGVRNIKGRFKKIGNKLSPVKKIAKNISGISSKVLGSVFGNIAKVFSIAGKIKHMLLIAFGSFILISLAILLVCMGILALLNNLSFSESKVVVQNTTNKLEKGMPVAVAEQLVKKDNEWLQEIVDSVDTKSPKEANGGKKVYGGENPFDNGKKYELSTFDKATYRFYDGFAYPSIYHKKPLNINDLIGHEINPYSNYKSIMAAASIYTLFGGDDNYDNVPDFCEQLWEHSHGYETKIGDKYMCSGCIQKNISCMNESTYNKYTDLNGNHYDLIKGINSTKGCKFYFCNEEKYYDEDSSSYIKYGQVADTYDKKDQGCESASCKKKYKCYCKWSGKILGLEPAIEETGLNNQQIAYYNQSGHYRDVLIDNTDSSGEEFDDCSYAEIMSSSVKKDKVSEAINNRQIILAVDSSGNLIERSHGDTSYYIGYCSNMSLLGTSKQYDGYILINKDPLNFNQKKQVTKISAIALEGNNPMWFYNCQGHDSKKRVFSWCPGHHGCSGHDIRYCLGHCDLEVNASISGATEVEVNADNKDNNITGADNLWFNDNKGDYAKKWNGFEDSISFVDMICKNDWKEMYNIDDNIAKLTLPDTSKKKKSK